MLPATDKYGVWASSGEIDILEAKGRLTNRTYGNVHFGQPWPGNKYTGDMYKFPNDETFDDDYHIAALSDNKNDIINTFTNKDYDIKDGDEIMIDNENKYEKLCIVFIYS